MALRHSERGTLVLGLVAAVVMLAGCVQLPASERSGSERPGVGQEPWFHDDGVRITADYRAYGPGQTTTDGWAGSFQLEVEGQQISAFCVERHAPLMRHLEHAARHADEAGIANAGRAAWILSNVHSIPSALPDERDEHAAVQHAVWAVVDGEPVPPDLAPTMSARVVELLDASKGQHAEIGPSSYDLTLEAVPEQGPRAVLVTVLADGEPVSGAPVRLVGADGAELTVKTGDDGTVVVDAPGATDEIDGLWEGTAGPGVLFEPADPEGQTLMTADEMTISRGDSVTLGDPDVSRHL
ncbi:MAG: hypothetical protein JJU45_10585 [Acidimicrobiia bacterium]|nr:hypothetical protein [Acidimicrobiia bacterium]